MRQVFITGASSDIGIAICHRYLNEGYRVLAHFHKGQHTFNELLQNNDNITPIQIDFTNPKNIEEALKEDSGFVTSSDVLINAAAILESQPFSKITADTILKTLGVNLIPGLLLMRALTTEMMKRKWGRIVHLSSIGVKFNGGSTSFNYALSKHALEYFPADYRQWASQDVFVNAVRVGVTDTRFHKNDPHKNMMERVSKIPMGRMASPAEIAETVYFLGSNLNTYITGEVVTVAGGE